MTTGVVNASREAVVPLVVRGADGADRAVEALVDTGFTGSLTLPPGFIETLGLTWQGREQGILGDGSVGLFDIYAATVIWDGRERTVETAAADAEPLIGMALLEGHVLRVAVVEGGEVQIQAIEAD